MYEQNARIKRSYYETLSCIKILNVVRKFKNSSIYVGLGLAIKLTMK